MIIFVVVVLLVAVIIGVTIPLVTRVKGVNLAPISAEEAVDAFGEPPCNTTISECVRQHRYIRCNCGNEVVQGIGCWMDT